MCAECACAEENACCFLLTSYFRRKTVFDRKIDQHIGSEGKTRWEMNRKTFFTSQRSYFCNQLNNMSLFNCMFWQFATLLSMRSVSPMSSRHARVLRRVWSRIPLRIVGQSRRITREGSATSAGSVWMRHLRFIAWVSPLKSSKID